MKLDSAALSEIADYCALVLELTPRANDLLANLGPTEEVRQRYAATGFATVEDVLSPDAWTGFVTRVLPILSVISEEVTLHHEPTSAVTLSDGARFRRVDPHCNRNPDTREKLTALLGRLGLVELGSLLAGKLTPLIQSIVGPVKFERTYFYIYEEGDYISVHNDHQVGRRVDVQFPLTLGTVAGVRVLSERFLRMCYDTPGAMNLLGTCVWHDVPPILRMSPHVAPRRFNMGFRFTPQ